MLRLWLRAFFHALFGLVLLLRRRPSSPRVSPADEERFAALALVVESQAKRRGLSSGKSGPAFAARCPNCAARDWSPGSTSEPPSRVVYLFGPRGDA